MLARRHDVAAVEVVDRFERELPDIGMITVGILATIAAGLLILGAGLAAWSLGRVI